jgi:hypothetical protein
MGRTARVTSIEMVQDYRSKLAEFGKEAKDTLCAAEMHIRRTFDWLAERAKHWHKEIKVRTEEVVRAKIELTSRKHMCKDGRGPGTTDQEKALRKAQMRLKEAEEKAANCKRWGPLLQHAVHEYQGSARLLSGVLDTDLLNALAMLAQKLTALEAYLALQAPSLAPPPLESSSATDTPLESVGTPVTAIPLEEAKDGQEALQEVEATPIQEGQS